MNKLFIDDERKYGEYGGWNVVRTYSQAILMLDIMDFDVVSCDYSLDFRSSGKTGVDVIHWMAEHHKEPKEFIIHSTNIVGRKKMQEEARQCFKNTKITMNPLPK